MDASAGWDAVGTLIRNRRNELGINQATLADLLAAELGTPVNQTTISANENGQRWRDRPELLGAYISVLRLDVLSTLQTVYGVGLAAEQDRSDAPTFEELVRADSTLDEDSRQHLINQYGLLRRASAYARKNPEAHTA